MLSRAVLFLGILCLLSASAASAPISQPSGDAWPLYSRAIERVQEGYRSNIRSPAASNMVFAGYPPFSADWHRLESAAYDFNVPARGLVREARTLNHAEWPALPRTNTQPDMSYLGGCQQLAFDVADASMKEHLDGNDAGAIEKIGDLLHIADLLDGRAPSPMNQLLTSLGIRMLAMSRLEVIAADLSLTSDPADNKRLQVSSARKLIVQLFDRHDPAERYADLLQRLIATGELNTAMQNGFLKSMRRGQMECNLAAMSLACHLFRFEKHRWPAAIEEVIAYLPAPPRDAGGAMGYALVQSKAAGPADRPLVYSRYNANEGLFYPTNEPQYSFYRGIGSGDSRKEGGQFRDVSLWAPAHPDPAPTTQPLR